jgi:hypothetical protein
LFFSLEYTPASFVEETRSSSYGRVARSADGDPSFGEIAEGVKEWVNGTYTHDFNNAIPLPKMYAKLGNESFKVGLPPMFATSLNLYTEITLTLSLTSVVSVKNSEVKRVDVILPYLLETGLSAQVKAATGLLDQEIISTPERLITYGVIPLPIAAGAPVPIPWTFDNNEIGTLTAELGATFKAGAEISLQGDIGCSWEDGNFSLINPLPKSSASKIGIDPPTIATKIAFDYGPRFVYRLCGIPLISTKETVGVEWVVPLNNVADGHVDLKFKSSCTIDLLKTFAKGLAKFNKDAGKVQHTYTPFEFGFEIWPNQEEPPTAPDDPADPEEPVTNGNWIDVADTSWYDSKSKDTTFTISTAEELAGLAKIVKALSDDFYGDTITFMPNNNTIDLAGRQWTPIGSGYANRVFRGTFNGGGHTISNLTITQNIEDQYYYGLFETNRGTIKNINLTGVNINVSSLSTRAGGIAGENYGTLTSCDVSGSVSAIAIDTYIGSPRPMAGGIVGLNYGPLTDCNASVNVSASSSAPTSSSHAGGIAGGNGSGTITGCTASGGTSSSSDSNSYAGGIAGDNGVSGTITGCIVSSSVSSSSSDSISYAGGITGDNFGAITGCTASGSVSAFPRATYFSAYIGGIAGRNYENGTIMDCDARGKVTSTYPLPYEGGVIGYLYDASTATISNNRFSQSGTGQNYGIGHGGLEGNAGCIPY